MAFHLLPRGEKFYTEFTALADQLVKSRQMKSSGVDVRGAYTTQFVREARDNSNLEARRRD